MKRNKVIISLIITLVFITGAQNFAFGGAPTLKFPTKDIREMWWACSTEFRKLMPSIPEQIRIQLCDCYTDYMRTTFTVKEVMALTKEQSKILGLAMREKCPIPTVPLIST